MSVLVIDDQPVLVDTRPLELLADLILAQEGYPETAEVSLMLVTDDAIAEFNAAHLHRSGATDVLAFPVETLIAGFPPTPVAGGPPLLLGDVVIAPGYVARQAEELGWSMAEEMALMLTHGILHLLGYDHADPGEAEVMEAREAALLEQIGVTQAPADRG